MLCPYSLNINLKKAASMDGIQLAFALVIELWKLIAGSNIEAAAISNIQARSRKIGSNLKKYKLICENQINSTARKLVSFIEKKSTQEYRFAA